MPRGGKRKGAGRPCGKGPWKEETKVIRVPASRVNIVAKFLAADGYKIPLYSSRVPAGTPVDADDHIDKKIDLNSLLMKHPQDTFLLRVSGDSMIEANIDNKDILVVDRKLEPNNGQIVVAAVDGQATVKTFTRDRKGNITLVPANKKYKPITILPANDFQVLGVVTNVIRSMIGHVNFKPRGGG